MGCDIHTYVEYSTFTTREGEDYWKNLTKNGGSRDYLLFGVLAGVRVPDVKLFDPKGMPEGDYGWQTNEDYWTLIAPPSHPEWAEEDDDYCSLDKALEWRKHGSVIQFDKDGNPRRVSGPDWHSHSWLTTDELTKALEHYEAVKAKYSPSPELSPEWPAMLAAMRAFEERGAKTRLVFWFDN